MSTITDKTKYEGWTNYATWNVNLWVMNDYGLYCQWVEWSKEDNNWTADRVRSFFQTVMNGTAPDLDRKDKRDIDYQDIAESWDIDAKEQ